MPLALLTAVGVPMTAGPVNVTVTPGSTPPWSSETLPTSSPNVWPVCAAAGARPNAVTMARAARTRRIARVTDVLLGAIEPQYALAHSRLAAGRRPRPA